MESNLEAYGLHWRVGRPWGVAHPDDICYADDGEVDIRGNIVNLGVGLKPHTFHGKIYPWAVGYISSVERFKYGTFIFQFRLPLGRRLWPALWLCDAEVWPPEIDVVEGWSGMSPMARHTRHCYRRGPGLNRIFPGVHYGTVENHMGVSGGLPRRSTLWYMLHTEDMNTATLLWMPDRVTVHYNGHRVMDLRDDRVLAWLRDSGGMNIHLQQSVDNTFDYDDYVGLQRRELTVYDIKYQPL